MISSLHPHKWQVHHNFPMFYVVLVGKTLKSVLVTFNPKIPRNIPIIASPAKHIRSSLQISILKFNYVYLM